MPTLGQTLKEARERKKVTCSQAAAATRMKIQSIEAMERDDYSRVAAPIYAKGFLRLYAEYLGLDAAPLIREYMDTYAPKERPQLVAPDGPVPVPPPDPDMPVDESAPVMPRRPWAMRFVTRRNWKRPVAIGGGVLLVVVILGIFLSRCATSTVEQEEKKIAEPPPAPAAVERGSLPVVMDPPDSYIEPGAPSESKP